MIFSDLLRLLLSPLLSPFLFFWLLLSAAWLIHRKNPRWAKRLLYLALFWLLLVSTPFLPNWLVRLKENQYPPVDHESLRRLECPCHIMVLAAGYVPDARLPAGAQLNTSSLVRLAEGIRLHLLLPDSRLITSAKAAKGTTEPQSAVQARAAVELGVAPEAILQVPTAANTREEALHYRNRYGSRHSLIIVTDAVHMPRAMMHFRKAGLNPLAAPTNYRLKHSPAGQTIRYYLPGITHVKHLEAVMHECVGMWWGLWEWYRHPAPAEQVTPKPG